MSPLVPVGLCFRLVSVLSLVMTFSLGLGPDPFWDLN